MTILNFFSLLGGLGLFLYGMQIMSEGLELAAGDRLQAILERLTANRFVAIAVGAFITALVQSSSATTVMVVGFVNTSLMSLSQAVWIIMGANIGSTITGQMIALNIGEIAPLFVFLGVLVLTFFKKRNISCWGQLVTGLGILFIGMSMMSDAMSPLREDPTFINLMTTFDNPIIGICVGAIFTALIQSSAASIGILQTLANSGLIQLQSAAFILFGQNIGTCITSFFASLSANRNAKRTTIIHMLFNVVGTVLFVTICLVTPITTVIASWTPGNVSSQIANLHTIFNISTTLILLPFGNMLAKLSTIILPIKEDENKSDLSLTFINDNSLGSTATAFTSLKQEITHMFNLTKENIHLCYQMLLENKTELKDTIKENEKYIDFLNHEIAEFLSRVAMIPMNETDGYQCRSFFKIANDLERMSDIAYQNAMSVLSFKKNKIAFDDQETRNIEELKNLIEQSLHALQNPNFFTDSSFNELICNNENTIDRLHEAYKLSEIHLMIEKKKNGATCIKYSEILYTLERMHDYVINIQEECIHSLFNFNS